MNQNAETVNDTIERRLTRMACDVIVDSSPAAVAAALGELTAALEEGGAPQAAVRFREMASATGDTRTLPAVLRALWHDWFAEDEMRRDVESLAGDAELSGMFIGEALDHLGTIEATLLRLEDRPTDVTLLNDVFRPFHTIKGNAGALGVATVEALAHQVENLLDRCRSGRHRVGSNEVDIVLKSVDLLTAMLNDLSARCAGRPGRTLRAERLVLMESVEWLIKAGSAAAPLAGSGVGDTLPLADVAAPAALDAPARMDAGPPVSSAERLPIAAAVRGAVEILAPNDASRGEGQASVKVDTRKLDGLVDTVGELVILQSLLFADPALAAVTDERFTRNLAQLRRITTDLQRGAMAMRMVPIRQTFLKMSRLVRDLSKRSGKSVELVLTGEGTELDRKVVEDINDPLMHMVRNSLDHGLELRAARIAAGKPETGRLSLRAFHRGGSIVIEIADDGAGLNTERIARKAAEKGLIAPGAELSPVDVHRLIFAPGFSTVDQITEISGRGVGMDVVKRNIDALRGRIDIQTEAGKGTTFSINLPLTLAIVDGLLVSVGAQRFLIPTFAIRESLRPTAAQVHGVHGEPRLIQVRDQLLPLVWLRDLFGVDGALSDPTQGTVVVIEDETQRVGLVVDALLGKQEVVVKSLGTTFAGLQGIAGGAVLGDGRIGLILDAHGIIELMRAAEAA
jgi:two-component system chemotaxis sensor kinase CheA